MKTKLINRSIVFAICALIAGVFYREFTKFNDFIGNTTLGLIHSHLLVLGTLFMIILAICISLYNIDKHKHFTKTLNIYTIGLAGTTSMMLVRGIFQVFQTNLPKAANASISGLTGLFHIIIAIGFIYLLLMIKKAIADIKSTP